MVNPIYEEAVKRIRETLDMVQLISAYTSLKQKGSRYWGLCPFHNEKTPSFAVSPDKQLYHCFGCGAGGDMFRFIMEIEKVSFPEAVRLLATQVGIRLPERQTARAGDSQDKSKDALFDVNKLASGYYNHILHHTTGGKEALNYLKERGLPDSSIRRFSLGFAPDQWDGFLSFARKKGYGSDELLKAGLVTQRQDGSGYYDRFRGRIVFPIFDPIGRIIAFGGRILIGERSQRPFSGPKYLNSPDSHLFNKSAVLYGLCQARDAIRKKQQAIIVEGYMDVITAHQYGLEQTVASLGTALTERQAQLLRQQVEEVVIIFDADVAGEGAAWRGLNILRAAGCRVRVASLPEGLDPDDFLRSRGVEAFQTEVLEKASYLVEYQLNRILGRFDLDNRQEMLKCLRESLPVLIQVPDQLERDEYIRWLAGKFFVSEEALRAELKKLRGRPVRSGVNNIRTIKTKRDQYKAAHLFSAELNPVAAAERQLIAIMINDPEKIGTVRENLTSENFTHEPYRVIVQKLFSLDSKRKEAQKLHLSQVLAAFSGDKVHGLISELSLEDSMPETQVAKAVSDCIQKIKITRLHYERRVLEKQMKKLEDKEGKTDKETSSLLQQWWALRKREQELCRSGEEEGLGWLKI